MNYGQVRDQVLKLLNQYTVAGTPVPGSYNNQQDYLNRIPGLVNDALTEIATTARKIPATVNLVDLFPEEYGAWIRYALPNDFYQFVSGSVIDTLEGDILPANLFQVQGRKYLLVPKDKAGDYTITYYRYPRLISENPNDRTELDNEPETHYAVASYVAAHLLAHDNLSLSAMYHNAYEDKLAKMGPGVTAEVRTVGDVYGFFG